MRLAKSVTNGLFLLSAEAQAGLAELISCYLQRYETVDSLLNGQLEAFSNQTLIKIPLVGFDHRVLTIEMGHWENFGLAGPKPWAMSRRHLA